MTQLTTNLPVKDLVYTIRGEKVMLASDLAKLYEVETKRLNEAVKRDIDRFEDDFMFQLTKEETQIARSQSATLPFKDSGGYLPYVFTERGCLALSFVLRSTVAKEMSKKIIIAFQEMKEIIKNNIPQVPQTMGEILEIATKLNQEKLALEEDNDKLKSETNFLRRLTETEGLYTFEVASKILQNTGAVFTGRNALTKTLRKQGYLSLKNTPLQRIMPQELFAVKAIPYVDANGDRAHRHQTFVTQKGLTKLKRVLCAPPQTKKDVKFIKITISDEMIDDANKPM